MRATLNKAIVRRDVMKIGGGLAVCFAAGGLTSGNQGARADAKTANDAQTDVLGWVVFKPDGTVTIYNPAAEMGQGSMTGLPMILAEEMDIDWNDVRAEHSPAIARQYGYPLMGYNLMLTAGSLATASYYEKLRIIGMKVRYVLLYNAAKTWGVPIDELSTSKSKVFHQGSGRQITYADLATSAVIPSEIPEYTAKDFKPRSQFTIIGKSLPRLDTPDKVNGSAKFGIDMTVPDMVEAVIVRSPVHGGKLTAYSADKVPFKGLQYVQLAHGLAIVGENFGELIAARELVAITWDNGAADQFNSQETLKSYGEINLAKVELTKVHRGGDFGQEITKAAKVVEAEFYNDYAYHAQMETLSAVASYDDTMKSVEIWMGTQWPDMQQRQVAQALGIEPQAVKINRMLLGGGFGRRSMCDDGVEAAVVAKAIGKPVKVTWTRKDDIRYGAFRPMSFMKLKAGLDEQNKISCWNHVSVGDGKRILNGGMKIPAYDVPNQEFDTHDVTHSIRLKDFRAVGYNANKFAIESFTDVVAHSAGEDPVAFRRKHIKNEDARACLDRVVAMSGWDSYQSQERALGVALVEHDRTNGACVVEVSLDRERYEIGVHQVWIAINAGIVIHPNNAIAQIEGGAVMGISSALKEQITIRNGVVEQSNYDDYPILRMNEVPKINVAFIGSDAPPLGVGESSTPMMAPAIANAFFKLTGKRLFHMPFTNERVKEALHGP